MALPAGEPDSPQAVADWIEKHARPLDRFSRVRRESEQHRQGHGNGCSVYPTGSGPALGVLTAAIQPARILEAGCGLGYSALWLAFGAPVSGRVETIERDPIHAELASRNFQREGFSDRITVLTGKAVPVLSSLTGPYDLVFCDSDPDDYLQQLDHFLRLLRPGGLLVTSNLFLGQYTTDLPGAPQMAAYRQRILNERGLTTAFLPGGLALSVRARLNAS
jgi:predicted O-methyltransferase YrrM